MSDIIIAAADQSEALQSATAALADELGLPPGRLDALPAHATMALVLTSDRLELREVTTTRHGERSAPVRGALAVDFSDIDLRTGSGNLSKKQPLARAFGGRVRTILDATAGLGHDAFLLTCCGFDVTAVERNAVIFALLRDGVRRAEMDSAMRRALGGRLRVLHGDARQLQPPLRPDAVYLDPMFPSKKRRSALAPKSIRLVRALVGDDPDADDLLATAIQTATDRVVVKRPTHAPPLSMKPSVTIRANLVRYDVYLVGRGA